MYGSANAGTGQMPKNKINQIQVVGTHNSYAQPADPKVLDMASPIISGLMQKFGSSMSEEQKAKFKEYHPYDFNIKKDLIITIRILQSS